MMRMDESNATSSTGGFRAHAPRRRLWPRVVAFIVFLALAAFVAGFVWFACSVSGREVKVGAKADGIVVLTGGASRVADGIELLSAGLGRRLLISGVHPSNSPDALQRMLPEHRRLFECCVDLDRSARNTHGNAIEAARWVEQQGFRSLIVVTSNYHMPRALIEFSHRMPAITLHPFPVVTEKWRSEPWWQSASSGRLLLSEYIKFLAAACRARLSKAGVPDAWLFASEPPPAAAMVRPGEIV